MNRVLSILVAIGLGPVLSAPAAAQQGDPPELDDDEAERCLSTTRIDRTEVLDDYNILFHMRGRDIYLNRLPRRCAGLRANRAFSYRSTISRLCDLDIITVIDNVGFGVNRGASCSLGPFLPVTEEYAEVLREGPPPPKPQPVPPAEPEPIEPKPVEPR